MNEPDPILSRHANAFGVAFLVFLIALALGVAWLYFRGF
jgi:hypothetical protein